MIDPSSARRLARYRRWADQLTFDAVAALPPGEATKQRPTLFKTMIGTLNHSYLIDLVWQAQPEGRDHGLEARNLVLHQGCPLSAMSRGDILVHVVNHATYHRGWIAEMFFQVPARSPATDRPVYLRGLELAPGRNDGS